MAKYNYDEAGNMAAYFIITFLALLLVPTTLAAINSSPRTFSLCITYHLSIFLSENKQDACQCTPCTNNRRRLDRYQKGSLRAKVTKRYETHHLRSGVHSTHPTAIQDCLFTVRLVYARIYLIQSRGRGSGEQSL